MNDSPEVSLEELILELMRRKPEGRFNARQIAHHLELASSLHKELRKDLKILINKGKLIVDREGRFTLRDENRVVKGVIKLHADGYGFLLPEDKSKADVFIPKRFMNFAMNGDVVLAESYRNPQDGRYEGRIIQIVQRAHQTVVGTVRQMGDQYFVKFRDARIGVEEIYIPKKNLGKATHNDFVAVKILQFPGPGIMGIGEITNVIGLEVDEKSLKEAVLIQHGIARRFPEAVHHELEKLPAEVEDVLPERRVDLRDLPIITIDGVTAKDFDDAVCAVRRGKNYVLWVSIADVAEYVRTGAALDKEAYKRGTSTYLPGECVPMLPEKLSNGLCSLNPFVPRLTLTAEIHYNSNMDFVQATYYRSLIKSHKRATYDEVQAYYDKTGGHDFSPEVKKSLDVMRGMAETLIERTRGRGAMAFDLPEPEVIFDGAGKITTIKKRQRFFSHKLIEQFMIAANVAVAQFFTTRDLPQVYRIHDAPDRLKMQDFLHFISEIGLGRFVHGFHPADFFRELSGHRMETFLQTVFLRSLKQAVYSPDNIGHYGLALKDYAHFTSPIRRYPDLIVHRQLRSILDQYPDGIARLDKSELKREPHKAKFRTTYSYSDLLTIGNASSKRERESVEAEREVSDIKKAFFMKDHLHEKFFGIVSRVTKFGIYVELDPHFVEGFLLLKEMRDDYYIFDEKKIRLIGRRSKAVIGIGDRLYVTVHEIDSQTSQIRLALVSTNGASERGKKQKKEKHKKGKKKGRR